MTILVKDKGWVILQTADGYYLFEHDVTQSEYPPLDHLKVIFHSTLESAVRNYQRMSAEPWFKAPHGLRIHLLRE